ncbi:hypothetical protein SHIRM173S_11399 [Streptomyces hirsutus]
MLALDTAATRAAAPVAHGSGIRNGSGNAAGPGAGTGTGPGSRRRHGGRGAVGAVGAGRDLPDTYVLRNEDRVVLGATRRGLAELLGRRGRDRPGR